MAGFSRIIQTYKTDPIAAKAMVHLAYCLEKQNQLENASIVCNAALQEKLDDLHQVDCQFICLKFAKSKGNEADVARIVKSLKSIPLTAEQQQALDEASDQAADAMGNLKNLENQLATGNLSARENQIKSAEASVEIAQSSLDQAAWMLGQTIVRAPEDGFVFDNLYWPGEEVPAVTPVITLLSPDHIKVIFYIPEPWLASLTMGENINFTADGLNQIGHAKISYISPSAEYTPPVIYSRDRQDQLVYRIEANFSEPKDALVWHPGQPVTVTIPEAVPEAVKKDIKTGTVQS